ncbi:hypothetical protein FPQ18DRAFT_396945 [Pyronema domesticum]|nr:hypothetical protein FPQ18DRAFT_396945 [Pyronema domesticum]
MRGLLGPETILNSLPETKAFVDSIPRKQVQSQAAANNRRAQHAHQLLKQVDGRIEDHVAAATELKTLAAQLGAMDREIEEARKLAKNIQTQLLELETLVTEAVGASSQGELLQLQRAEDERFERHAKERRQALEKAKRGYAEQLGVFEKERIRMLASGGDAEVRRKKVVEVRGLETVKLETGKEQVLDDFFGGDAMEIDAGPAEMAVVEEAAKPKKEKGKGKSKEEKTKPKPKAPAPVPTAKKKVNPAIMADEDIEDDEEMMAFYR